MADQPNLVVGGTYQLWGIELNGSGMPKGRVWTDKEAWVGWNLKSFDQVFDQILKASKVIIAVNFSCN